MAHTVDIIAPTLSYPFLTLPICVLIAFNLLMHYYYVITVSPGFIDDPPRIHGKGIMWAQKSGQKKLFSGRGGGVRWTSPINITKAEETQCNKCAKTRPEVCHFLHILVNPKLILEARELIIVEFAIVVS